MTYGGSAPASDVTFSGSNVTDNGDKTATIPSTVVFDSEGKFTLQVTSTYAEANVNINVTEGGTSADTVTDVTWNPGGLDHYTATASDYGPTAGGSVTITLVARDVYGNAIPNANPSGAITCTASGADDGTRITWGGDATDNGDGTGTIPDTTDADGNGEWSLTLSYEVAGDEVVPDFSGGGVSGSIDAGITWHAINSLSSFVVEASPTDLTAGQASTITITARD